MTTQYLALTLVAAHFIGDWLLQDRKMATTKSKDLMVLLAHVSTVTLVLTTALCGIGSISSSKLVFGILANGVIHGLIDWNGWKYYKWKHRHAGADFKYWEDKGFYDTIALDQLAHIATLFLLFL